jgi:hypothetical protein
MTLDETVRLANRAAILGELLGSFEDPSSRLLMISCLREGGFLSPSTVDMLIEVYVPEAAQ